MERNNENTSAATGVQVFELTMDNDEDQDELNRRLRKPGEPVCGGSIQPAKANSSLVVTEAEKTVQQPR